MWNSISLRNPSFAESSFLDILLIINCIHLHLPLNNTFSSWGTQKKMRPWHVCKRTWESATLVRPRSLMRWFTRASFSLWGTELGSRSAAEKRRFSLTVKVPMTTSSCKGWCKASPLPFQHYSLQNNQGANGNKTVMVFASGRYRLQSK